MEKPAFDAVAENYDAAFTHTLIGQMLRQQVWAFGEKYLPAGTAVLELNCGTGEDAVWLAKRGHRVLATDVSAAMLRLTEQKVAAVGLTRQVSTQLLDLRGLDAIADGAADHAWSDFGGLNCLSPDDLRAFAAHLPQKIKPEGRFVAVVMGRFCLWETLYFLWKGTARAAFRRWRGGPVMAPLQVQESIRTWYYGPDELCGFFRAQGWRVLALTPIGIALPPSYLASFFEKKPRFARFLQKTEQFMRGKLWARSADHYLLVLQAPRHSP